MKKILLLILSVLAIDVMAQCPVTVNGQATGGSFNVCQGDVLTLAASGAQTYTWAPATGLSSSTGGSVSATPLYTTTYTVYGSANSGTCLDSNRFTIYVSPNPTITTNNPGLICSGSTVTLCASGAQTYSWTNSPYLGCTACACTNVNSPIASSTFTVCGGGPTGCISCTTVTIGVSPTPTVSFSLTNSAPQVWDASANYSGNVVSYAWDFGDGTTSSMAYPSHTYTAAGWYNVCVTVTDAYGCTGNFCLNDSLYRTNNSMITLNVINGTTGIIQNPRNNIGFYPNPANEQLIINENISVCEIYDISGKLVLTKNINGKTALNITSLPEGIYMLRLKNKVSWSGQKLVIAR